MGISHHLEFSMCVSWLPNRTLSSVHRQYIYPWVQHIIKKKCRFVIITHIIVQDDGSSWALDAHFSLKRKLLQRRAWVRMSPYLDALPHKPRSIWVFFYISKRDTRGLLAWGECPQDQDLLVSRSYTAFRMTSLAPNPYSAQPLDSCGFFGSLLHRHYLILCLLPSWLVSLPVCQLCSTLPGVPAVFPQRDRLPSSWPLVLSSPWT